MIDTATKQYYEERAEKRGEARGKREAILQLGTRRFGKPSDLTRSLLDEIDSIERLNSLALRVFDAESWSDLLGQ